MGMYGAVFVQVAIGFVFLLSLLIQYSELPKP